MKRILTLCAIVAGLVGVPTAQAAVVTNETLSQPFSRPLPCPIPCGDGVCRGELIVGTIDLHVLITSTANDNHVSLKNHGQSQGGSAVGVETGDTYRVTGVTQEMSSESLLNGQSTSTFVNNFHLIGPGPGNNFLIHEVDHVTTNANGEVTAQHDNLNVGCK